MYDFLKEFPYVVGLFTAIIIILGTHFFTKWRDYIKEEQRLRNLRKLILDGYKYVLGGIINQYADFKDDIKILINDIEVGITTPVSLKLLRAHYSPVLSNIKIEDFYRILVKKNKLLSKDYIVHFNALMYEIDSSKNDSEKILYEQEEINKYYDQLLTEQTRIIDKLEVLCHDSKKNPTPFTKDLIDLFDELLSHANFDNLCEDIKTLKYKYEHYIDEHGILNLRNTEFMLEYEKLKRIQFDISVQTSIFLFQKHAILNFVKKTNKNLLFYIDRINKVIGEFYSKKEYLEFKEFINKSGINYDLYFEQIIKKDIEETKKNKSSNL